MGNSINSEYLPNGSVQTTTDTPGLPQLGAGANFQLPRVPQINADYLNYIAKTRNAEAGDANQRKREAYEMQLRAMQEDRGNAEQDRIYAQQARYRAQSPHNQVTPTWYESQGAATRPVGLGAQMIPGEGIDPRLLPPSMRPSESKSTYSPSSVYDQQLAADDEASWQKQINADRARTSGQTGEVGGAAKGTPGGSVAPQGTAPMLTPSNAAVQGRQLSPQEMELQRQRNAMYGH